MKDIISLNSDVNSTLLELIGEKAFNLIYLKTNGFPVPNGFVITSEYDEFIHGKLKSLIRDELTLLKSKYLMVRSSGVGEDGTNFSFAGQLDSFQVKNELDETVDAIIKCYDGLSNKRLKIYSESNNKTLLKMGIIIQEMIEPDYAGVLFTSAPNMPGEKMVEYVKGHCEKLVSGKVTPNSLYLPSNKEDDPVFTQELNKVSIKIYDLYQKHQDIEWAFKDGELFIVQSRPITNIANWISWSSTNVNENYPDKLSPLLYSVARRSYYHYFTNLADALNIERKGFDESFFANIIGEWGERMYYNMSSIHQVIALSPFGSMMGQSFDNFVGYQKKINKKQTQETWNTKARFILKIIYHGYNLEKKVKLIESRVDDFQHRRSDQSVAINFHEFLSIRFNDWINATFADFFSMLSHGALGKFLEYMKFKDVSGLQNSIIQSIPNLISNKPIFKLWEIKQYVLNKEMTDLFKTEDSGQILSDIKTEDRYKELNLLIQGFLDEWGFRCSGELALLSQNFCEKPETFIQMFKSYVLTENFNPNEQFRAKHEEQKKILKELLIDINHKFFFLKAIPYTWAITFLVKFTMYSISCRERVRLKQARLYFEFKKTCLKFGDKLERSGVLIKQSDIFFLEYDEISRLLNEEFIDKEYYKNLVQLRHQKFKRAEEFPENFHGNNSSYLNHYINQDDNVNLVDGVFSGLPACGGCISARAVVLDSIHEIHKLKKGDILITKQTDPGWICAFPLISGLVVERGGMLSHGAIVAREFGIPAVVGIKGITEEIKTNDFIKIDGNKGTVECLTQ